MENFQRRGIAEILRGESQRCGIPPNVYDEDAFVTYIIQALNDLDYSVQEKDEIISRALEKIFFANTPRVVGLIFAFQPPQQQPQQFQQQFQQQQPQQFQQPPQQQFQQPQQQQQQPPRIPSEPKTIKLQVLPSGYLLCPFAPHLMPEERMKKHLQSNHFDEMKVWRYEAGSLYEIISETQEPQNTYFEDFPSLGSSSNTKSNSSQQKQQKQQQQQQQQFTHNNANTNANNSNSNAFYSNSSSFTNPNSNFNSPSPSFNPTPINGVSQTPGAGRGRGRGKPLPTNTQFTSIQSLPKNIPKDLSPQNQTQLSRPPISDQIATYEPHSDSLQNAADYVPQIFGDPRLQSISTKLSEICCDPLGSQIIMDNMDVASLDERKNGLSEVLPRIDYISQNECGSKFVIYLIETGTQRNRQVILSELEPKISEIALNPHGSLVVIALLKYLSGDDCINDTIEDLKDSTFSLLEKMHSSMVVIELLQIMTPTQLTSFIEEVLKFVHNIVSSEYGIKVLQTLVQLKMDEKTLVLFMKKLNGNVVSWCCQENGSKFIQSCLKHLAPKYQKQIIEEIIHTKVKGERGIILMSKTKSAQPVVQLIQGIVQGEQANQIASQIREYQSQQGGAASSSNSSSSSQSQVKKSLSQGVDPNYFSQKLTLDEKVKWKVADECEGFVKKSKKWEKGRVVAVIGTTTGPKYKVHFNDLQEISILDSGEMRKF